MIRILSKSLRSQAGLLLLVVFCTVTFQISCPVVHAQVASEPDPGEPSPGSSLKSETAVSPPNPTSVSAPPSSIPGLTGTPTPNLPNPIYSTSDACVACQTEYPSIRNCSIHIPHVTVNLTMIVQVLPFYNCICQDNMVHIDGIQTCSNCFRSTGQQVFLSPHFYNVTNQQVKALKQVCKETASGTRVPNSEGTGKWETLARSGSWTIISILVATLLLFGNL